jgi:hypothetical protein
MLLADAKAGERWLTRGGELAVLVDVDDDASYYRYVWSVDDWSDDRTIESFEFTTNAQGHEFLEFRTNLDILCRADDDEPTIPNMVITPHRDQILAEVHDERERQEQLCAQGFFEATCAGQLTELERLAVLAEEFGEVAHEIGDLVAGKTLDRAALRVELIQLAAVAVAWVEGLDRK